MALSRDLTFADPDQYQSALRAVQADVVVSGKGSFQARLTTVTFPRLWIQSGSDNLPRVARLANDPARAPIFFPNRSSQAPVLLSGKEVSPNELVVFRKGDTYINRSVGPSSWAAMSLDPEVLADIGRVMTGHDLASPAKTFATRPPPQLLARLARLHRRAIRLAAESPDRLGHAEVARAVEHELIHLMVRCATAGLGSDDRIGNSRHKAIIRKFEELAMAFPHRPIHLAEVCAATGATERTLLRCCHEQLGMGPIRFLWLRRMKMVRAALVQADAASSSVTTVATAHGFWELGRFAVGYRKLFGESPSRTLARPPARCDSPDHPLRLPRGPLAALAGIA